MSIKWWNENKMWLAPFAALIMWAVSAFCFIFGLSFENPVGFTIASLDVSMWVAISLSLANSIIQIIGNGKKQEDMDFVFKVGWYSSYVLGIASNVNFLVGVLGMDNVFLEWTVSFALGSMVEIMPEKLIMMWLKSVQISSQKPKITQPNFQSQKSQYKPQHKPQHPSMPTPKPNPVWPPNGQQMPYRPFTPRSDEE